MPHRTGIALVALAACLVADAARGQSIRVRVAEAASAQPLQGALTTLDPAGAGGAVQAFTNVRGETLFADLAPGAYAVAVELIGYRTGTREVVLEAGEAAVVEMTLESRAIEIEGLEVEAEGRCSVRPGAGLAVAEVWDEVRKALEAASLTDARGVYQYRTRRWSRNVEEESGLVSDARSSFGRAYQSAPFESRPVADLLENGFVQDTDDEPGGEMYFAPDASVLLSDAFLDSHCLRVVAGRDEEAGLVGVAFEPVRDRRVADIAGTLWVDPESWRLRHLEFQYVHTRPDVETHDIGGEVVFQQLPDGTWIVPEWTIRTPLLALGRDGRGRESIFQLGWHDVGAAVVSVREPGGDVLFTAATAALEGVVVREDGGEPVAGAVVTLEGSSGSTVTDLEGTFRLTDVPEGDYVVVAALPGPAGEQASMPVSLRGGEATSVTLTAVDAFAAYLDACRREEGAPVLGTAVVVGRVTAAHDGRPLEGARVTIEWDDLSRLRERGIPDRATLTSTTGADGLYRACGVPTEVPLEVQVEWGEVRTNPEEWRLELVSGAARDLVVDVGGAGAGGVAPDLEEGRAPVFEIEGLDVEVAARRIHLQAVGFYDRKAEDLGVYLTAEEIRPQLPTTIPQLLERRAGIFIATTAATAGAREVVLVKPGCLPALYIDGALTRRTQPFHRNPNPMVARAASHLEASPLYLTDLVSPEEIAGIEVYRSPAELPLQYGGTGGGTPGVTEVGADGRHCGVILVWTH